MNIYKLLFIISLFFLFACKKEIRVGNAKITYVKLNDKEFQEYKPQKIVLTNMSPMYTITFTLGITYTYQESEVYHYDEIVKEEFDFLKYNKTDTVKVIIHAGQTHVLANDNLLIIEEGEKLSHFYTLDYTIIDEQV